MVNSAMKRYKVRYAFRGNPRNWDVAIVNAPSMEFIRSNWNAICGGMPYVIQKIERF